MGIFDFILGKTIKIDDPFFGKMNFSEFKKNPEKNYFECRRQFSPTNNIIEIGINADISGPSDKQKDFFKNIEVNYDKITSSIKPLIENEFKNWKEDFEILDFKKEFIAEYLNLPRCENEPINWEISFTSEHDLNHNFSVSMLDLNAKELMIDG